MLYKTDSEEFTLDRTNNLQTIRPFPEPAFPFLISHLQMSKLSMHYIPWHWHDEFEIIWVNTGTLIVGTRESSIYVHAQEGLFLNSCTLHTMHTEGGKDCEFFIIRFDSKLLFPSSATILPQQYLHPILFSKSLQYIHITKKSPLLNSILQLIQDILQICYKEVPCNELMILSKMYELWAKLNLYANEAHPFTPLTTPVVSDYSRIIEAVHYIADHYSEPITLEDIANSIHLSKSECCRCFKRSISSSPIEFLIQYRIMAAIRRMQNKDSKNISVAQLAVSVGFNNASYFNKQFKKYLECTPLEYKKKLVSDYNEIEIENELLSNFFKLQDL